MFRPFAFAAALALLSAMPLYAQDDALRAAAERYVNNPVQQEMLDDLLSADVIVSQVRAMVPGVTEEQLLIVGEIGAEEMAVIRPELEAATIEAAIATFTLEEIEALEAFYATPLGASVLSKMQPFMESSMALAGPAMQAAQGRISARLMQALQ